MAITDAEYEAHIDRLGRVLQDCLETKRSLHIAEHQYLPSQGKGVGFLMKPNREGEVLFLFAPGEMPDDEQLGRVVNQLRDEGYEVAVERDLVTKESL